MMDMKDMEDVVDMVGKVDMELDMGVDHFKGWKEFGPRLRFLNVDHGCLVHPHYQQPDHYHQ